MQNSHFARLLISTVFASALAFFAVGCDQVKEMANDVQKKVMDEKPDSTKPAVAGENSQTPTPTPAPTAVAPMPTPEELVAEFKSLKPYEVNDGALARLASQPAAAGMIKELDIGSPDFSAGGLKAVSLMSNLTSLKIAGDKLDAEDLKQIASLTSLKQLNLAASRIDDSAILSLSGLPQLESLNLSGTRFTSAASAGLSQMKHLQEIDLTGTPADDTIVAALSALPIRKINLIRTRITNNSPPLLLKFPNLEELITGGTSVTGVGFDGFGKSSLKVLNVSGTSFGIEGFMAIKGMRSLEELVVYEAGLVEHKNADVFKTFPKLKILHAGRNSITDAGMKVFFQGHRSLESLDVGANKGITDNGLAALVGIKTLKHLDVTDTAVGARGAEALKKKLPNCTIVTSSGQY